VEGTFIPALRDQERAEKTGRGRVREGKGNWGGKKYKPTPIGGKENLTD